MTVAKSSQWQVKRVVLSDVWREVMALLASVKAKLLVNKAGDARIAVLLPGS